MTRSLITGDDGVTRCFWGASAAYALYHDEEWGMPTEDDRWIFEKICLEGFQSGLSWLTILNKRDNFRKAFKNFDIRLQRALDMLAGLAAQLGRPPDPLS